MEFDMSLASAVSAANTQQQRQMDTSAEVASADGGKPDDIQTAIDKVATYIPTEAVGVYVAVVGILSPIGIVLGWVLLAIGVAFVLALVFLNESLQARKRPANNGSTSPPRLLKVCLLGVVAFVAWAAALPVSPFQEFGAEASKYGGVAVIVLAGLLPRLAEYWGIQPN